MGGYAGLNHEIDLDMFGKPFGILGWKGFLLQGAGYDTAAFALFLFQMVFMDTTATIPTGARGGTLEVLRVHDLRLLHRHDHVSGVRQLGLGRRLALADWASTSASATATWISPARRSCTCRAA